MRIFSKITIILSLIILVGVLLRFYDLSDNPSSLTWDEASLGYNAYSILETGRDEYGKIFPLNLKSFGDYKPALYAYLIIPFLPVFGLSELSVRLPSAILGSISVLLVFILINDLFKNKALAVFCAFVMAISPLAIQFQRPAYESSVALFLNLAATILFLRSKKSNMTLYFSAALFILSLYAYQASRLFVPILITGLVIGRKDLFKSNSKQLLISGFLIAGLATILVYLLVFRGEGSRLSAVNFFSYTRSENEVSLIAREAAVDRLDPVFQLLHGEWWSFIKGLVERYLVYFSPSVLFIKGDYSPRHSVPDLGVLYYFDIFLIPLGLMYLVNNFSKSKLIIFWLLIAPLPAVFSRDLISMVRAFNLVVPLTIISGAGLYQLYDYLKSKAKIIRLAGLLSISGIILVNLFIYTDRYFIHAPIENARAWVYGYKEVALLIKDKSENYDHIVISDYLGQPYIYYLFYSQYPPKKYQAKANLIQNTTDVGSVKSIDNIEFRQVMWPSDRGTRNSLFIGPQEEIPIQDVLPFSEFKVLKEINFPDNRLAFRIINIEK